MKKFRFLKISKSKKLRYTVNNPKDKLYVVFLHGFMSDIEGAPARRPQRGAAPPRRPPARPSCPRFAPTLEVDASRTRSECVSLPPAAAG